MTQLSSTRIRSIGLLAIAILFALTGCTVATHATATIPTLPACNKILLELNHLSTSLNTKDRIPQATPGPMRFCRYRWDYGENKLTLFADITRPLAPAALLHALSQLKTVNELYGPNAVLGCTPGHGNADVVILRTATGSELTIVEVQRDGCREVIVTHAGFVTYLAYMPTASLLAQLDAITATPTAPIQTVPSSLSLCTVAKKVTTLTVRRGTFMNPRTFSFPSVVFVDNAASARSVAKAICAIPPDMRTEAIPCPFDLGPTYRLIFTLPKYVIAPITLRGSGICSAVDGTGKQGWIHLTPILFRVLGNAMQLHLATGDTFAGTMTISGRSPG